MCVCAVTQPVVHFTVSGHGRRHSSTNYVDWDILFSDQPTKQPSSVASNQSVMEFQELMKNDARSALRTELEGLCNTAPEDQKNVSFLCFLFYLLIYLLLFAYLFNSSLDLIFLG